MAQIEEVKRRTRAINETSTILGVSRQTVVRMLARGELTPIRIGGRVMVLDEEIESLLRSKKQRIEQAA